MKVLVTGATGFIGGNLARELVKQGYQVRALVRKGSNLKSLQGLNMELAEGDLLDKTSLEKALEGCEGLVSCCGDVYLLGAESQIDI